MSKDKKIIDAKIVEDDKDAPFWERRYKARAITEDGDVGEAWDDTEKDAIERAAAEAKSDKGCFLTTACVINAGLSDDCYELTTLRRFRDQYVAKSDTGKALIEEYYLESPILVEKINSSSNRDTEYTKMLSEIRDIVHMIDLGENGEAIASYKKLVARLRTTYS